MLFWYNLKTLVEAILSISILMATFKTYATFKFKLNADERKLYLDNANKVREVLSYIFRNGRIETEQLVKLSEAFQDASLYLSYDIVDYIDNVYKNLNKLCCIQNKLTDSLSDKEKTKLCTEQEILLNKVKNYNDDLFTLYRKHIIDEPRKLFNGVISKINIFSHKK